MKKACSWAQGHVEKNSYSGIPSLHEHFAGCAKMLSEPQLTSTKFEAKFRARSDSADKKCHVSFHLKKGMACILMQREKGHFGKRI